MAGAYDGSDADSPARSSRPSPGSRSSPGWTQAALERVAAGHPDAPVPPRRGHLPRRRSRATPCSSSCPGEVKISLPSETGDEAILATLGRATSSASWPCSTARRGRRRRRRSLATEAVVLPRDQFRELIATEPAVRDALLASLAGELRRLTIHVEELHFLDMTGRLAARLVRLAAEAGPPARIDDGTIRLRATLTQAELASMVGCTRQSVNKLLGQFADDGLVRLDREGIAGPRPARAGRRRAALSAASAGGLAERLEQDRGRGEGRPRASHRTGQEHEAPDAALAGGRDDRDRDRRVAGPRPGPDGQPDLGAAQLAGAPRVADEVVGRRVVGRIGGVWRRAHASDPWAVAAGASAAIDSSKRSHGASPNSAVDAPAGPDLDDRQRPAELAEARADRLAPGRLAGRPDVVAELVLDDGRAAASTSVLGRPIASTATAEIRTSTASTRAYVATIGLVARSIASPSSSATCDSPIPASR